MEFEINEFDLSSPKKTKNVISLKKQFEIARNAHLGPLHESHISVTISLVHRPVKALIFLTKPETNLTTNDREQFMTTILTSLIEFLT